MNRNAVSGQGNEECLAVPNSSTSGSVQLVQQLCNGDSSQSFNLNPVS